MPVAGLVGGLGPESTIDYYRRILALWQAEHPDTLPALLIDSLDVNRGIRLVQSDQPALVEYLLSSAGRLHRAGCAFAAITANTPHIVFDEVAARSPLPLLSIVEVCAAEAAARGFRRVGLLGTGFTMSAAFYPAVFGRRGIEVRTPDADARAWLHDRYLGELLKGIFRDETRAGVLDIVAALAERQAIEAIVLAGTELPLLVKSEHMAGLPVLDTTELHVRAIVRRLGEPESEATGTQRPSTTRGV